MVKSFPMLQEVPPMLVIWGQNDPIFGADGARAFARDLPQSEIILLDTGHFGLQFLVALQRVLFGFLALIPASLELAAFFRRVPRLRR